MSQTGRAFGWNTTRLCALCLIVSCLVFGTARACTLPSSQGGILFDHIPDGIDAPVVAEVTIVSREANVSFPNHAQLAVMNARVERVIKGTLESDVLKVVTYLNSCSRIGAGHGFVAGTLRRDAQRGLELVAIQRPYEYLMRGRVNSDALGRNIK
jgi:hypothetical protein